MTPGKRRSSRRKTPTQIDLKMSVENEQDKTLQDSSSTQNYIALLKSLGADIRASQPYRVVLINVRFRAEMQNLG